MALSRPQTILRAPARPAPLRKHSPVTATALGRVTRKVFKQDLPEQIEPPGADNQHSQGMHTCSKRKTSPTQHSSHHVSWLF